jgi:hypothetical protein
MEEVIGLKFEGAVDVARWTCKAWQSGLFDWNKIAGDNSKENVAERWSVVRWLNAEGHLDCLNEPDVEERELTCAIMMAFASSGLRKFAEQAKVTPQDWMDLSLSNAEETEELAKLDFEPGHQLSIDECIALAEEEE